MKFPSDVWNAILECSDVKTLQRLTWSSKVGCCTALPHIISAASCETYVRSDCILALVRGGCLGSHAIKREWREAWKKVATAQLQNLDEYDGHYHSDSRRWWRQRIARFQAAIKVALVVGVPRQIIREAADTLQQIEIDRRNERRRFFDEESSDSDVSDYPYTVAPLRGSKAVRNEIEIACLHNRMPQTSWIKLWLKAGAAAEGMELLAKSSLPVNMIVLLFRLLVKHSKHFLSGLSLDSRYPGHGDIILQALRRKFQTFSERSQWANSWKRIAEQELYFEVFFCKDGWFLRKTLEAAIVSGAHEPLIKLGMKRLRLYERQETSDGCVCVDDIDQDFKKDVQIVADEIRSRRPGVLSRTVWCEIARLMEDKLPSLRFIKSWLRIDEAADVNILDHERGGNDLNPLEICARSGAKHAVILGVIESLLHHHGRARGEFILQALSQKPCGQWVTLWAQAASAQLRWATAMRDAPPRETRYHVTECNRFPQQKPAEIQFAALVAAMMTGVATPDVEHAKNLQRSEHFSQTMLNSLADKVQEDVGVALSWLKTCLMVPDNSQSYEFDGFIVDTGNLLEDVSRSTAPPDMSIVLVAYLSSHGGVASGQAVLHALRRKPEQDNMRDLWGQLWGAVCEAHLRQVLRVHSKQLLSTTGTAEEDEEFLDLYDSDFDDEYHTSVLHDAVIAAIALGVSPELCRKALTISKRYWSCALFDTVLGECKLAARAGHSPKLTWISSWLKAGASASKKSWIGDACVEFEEGLPSGSPLAVLAKGELDPAVLVDVVSLLVEYGDFGGFPSSEEPGDPIRVALTHVSKDATVNVKWELAWQAAAMLRITSVLQLHFRDRIDLHLARDLSFALSLSGSAIDELRCLAELSDMDEEDDRMRFRRRYGKW